MRRIAFLAGDSQLGGAEINLILLLRLLDREEFRPTLLVLREGPLAIQVRALGVAVIVLGNPGFFSTSVLLRGQRFFNPFGTVADFFHFFPLAWKISRILTENGIECICTTNMLAHFYGGIAARLARVSCVWHMQDIIDPSLASGLGRQFSIHASRYISDRIIAVSDAVRLGWEIDGYRNHTTVLYNAVDTDEFAPRDGCEVRKELGISTGAPVVGVVGRLVPWKGQKVFLEAARHVLDAIPQTMFVIAGDVTFGDPSYKQELARLAYDLGLQDNVRFAGFRTDVNLLYNAFDVGVVPSIEPDPSPRVVYEMMSSGLPIVATRMGGIPEIIQDKVSGILVEPSDPDALGAAILNILSHRPISRELSENARRNAIRDFSVKPWVRQMERILQDVCQTDECSKR